MSVIDLLPGLVLVSENGPEESEDLLMLRCCKGDWLLRIADCRVVWVDSSGYVSEAILQPAIKYPFVPSLVELALSERLRSDAA